MQNLHFKIEKFKVCKSVNHHTIKINQPTRYNNFSNLLLDVYLQLNMFRASSRPTSGVNNCINSLWVSRWRVVVAVLLVVVGPGPARPRQKALLSPRSNSKTRGCYYSCWAPDERHEDTRNML